MAIPVSTQKIYTGAKIKEIIIKCHKQQSTYLDLCDHKGVGSNVSIQLIEARTSSY